MNDPASHPEIMSAVADRVSTITLNRPKVMNAFSDGMREALLAQLARDAADPDVGCIVITGAGRAFCAGGDIASMAELQARDDTRVIEGRMKVAAELVQLMGRIPKPVIAAVNGAAAGGGMNLALACDMRIGSAAAIFAESFVRIGLVPDWGGFSLLTRLVGSAKAMELMMTGDRIDAEEALRLGLLNQLCPASELEGRAHALAARLAAGPARTLAAIKAGVQVGASGSLADALAFEFHTQKSIFLSADAREGMSAFLEKRPPEFN